MGAPPKIYLLEKSPPIFYACQMCRETTKKNKFSWESWFTGDKLVICRECAYKESYGTKNIKKAKKERILEQKEINQ